MLLCFTDIKEYATESKEQYSDGPAVLLMPVAVYLYLLQFLILERWLTMLNSHTF
jgi:hypothetical protein